MIVLKKNGFTKKVSTGYSWKSLFFGVFYPMWRNDWRGVIYQTLLVIGSYGFCWAVVPFLYNKQYIKRLVNDGWKPEGEASEKYLTDNLGWSK